MISSKIQNNLLTSVYNDTDDADAADDTDNADDANNYNRVLKIKKTIKCGIIYVND